MKIFGCGNGIADSHIFHFRSRIDLMAVNRMVHVTVFNDDTGNIQFSGGADYAVIIRSAAAQPGFHPPDILPLSCHFCKLQPAEGLARGIILSEGGGPDLRTVQIMLRGHIIMKRKQKVRAVGFGNLRPFLQGKLLVRRSRQIDLHSLKLLQRLLHGLRRLQGELLLQKLPWHLSAPVFSAVSRIDHNDHRFAGLRSDRRNSKEQQCRRQKYRSYIPFHLFPPHRSAPARFIARRTYRGQLTAKLSVARRMSACPCRQACHPRIRPPGVSHKK